MDDLLKIIRSIKYYFTYADKDSIFIKVNINNRNFNNTAKAIKNLISEKKESSHSPLAAPPGRFRNASLEEYLLVYDCKQRGMTYKQTIENIGPKKEKENSSDRSIWTSYLRKVKNAKQIIKNIENGKFPGEYGDEKIDLL